MSNFNAQDMELLFLPELHFQEKGLAGDPHTGLSLSSCGCLPVALQWPYLLGTGSPLEESRSKSEVTSAGSRGVRCWEI